jgi:formylglycine-generating enzyme required for sulfatase activity
LLYFSGHGELDHRTGRLYLALPDSERDCLDGTALAAPFITDVMDRSSAGRQILILDCCYAGAIGRKGAVVTAATFGTDPAAAPAPAADAGYGRVILTSSTAGESSWEGNRVIAGVERSLFTHFLIQGLETGEAAAGAPAVSVEQLYLYVHAAVVKATAAGPRRMTPERFGQVRGELILARNPHARAPAPDPKDLLGADLLADLASQNHRTRIGAVGELANLMHQAPLRQAVIAVLEERLPRERDFQVRGLIETALKRAAADGGRGAEDAVDLPTTGSGAGEAVGGMQGRPPSADAEQGLPGARSKAAPDVPASRTRETPPASSKPAPAAAPLLKKPVTADPPRVKPRPGWLVPVVLGVAGVAAAVVWVPGMVSKPTQPVVIESGAASSAMAAAAGSAPAGSSSASAGAEEPTKPVPKVVAAAGAAPLSTFTHTLKDGSAGPTMVRIPAGTFQMGSPETEPERSADEKQHSVAINQPFAIGKYEVSFAEYDRFAKKTGRTPPDDSGWGRGDRPVINVSWDDATAYAAWLAEQTGRPYRLPNEAEWEYAARAGTKTPFWTGDCISTAQANYDGNSDYNGCGAKTGVYRKQTLPVDSLAANPWGLHQVAGNVWEWTCSVYADPYDGKEMKCISNNDAKSGSNRVVRGRAWDGLPSWLRSAFRNGYRPSTRGDNLGFRLAQDL